MYLLFPSALVFNPVTASIAGNKIINKLSGKNADVKLSSKEIRRLFREINRCRRRYKNWHIVEVRAADGSEVNIKL